MTNDEHGRPIDDIIGSLLHQTEAVVPIDEERLEQRRQDLLAWMEGSDDDAPASLEAEQPGQETHRSAETRPLSDVVFLTVAEVASVMRVSKMTVYRLVHIGHLPAIRVGRSFRVPEGAVHEYLRESFVGQMESTDWL
jgi:excisionase family DNA binding protein